MAIGLCLLTGCADNPSTDHDTPPKPAISYQDPLPIYNDPKIDSPLPIYDRDMHDQPTLPVPVSTNVGG